MNDQTVYVVERCIANTYVWGTTMAIFTHELAAKRYARKMNKEDAFNVILDAEGDVSTVIDETNHVCYDVKAFKLDDQVNTY